MRTKLGALLIISFAAASAAEINVIPRPIAVTPASGAFRIRSNTALAVAPEAAAAGRLLSQAHPEDNHL